MATMAQMTTTVQTTMPTVKAVFPGPALLSGHAPRHVIVKSPLQKLPQVNGLHVVFAFRELYMHCHRVIVLVMEGPTSILAEVAVRSERCGVGGREVATVWCRWP